MSHKNSFITAALEELQQESFVEEKTQVAAAPKAPGKGNTEVNLGVDKDIVAELMEQNVALADNNVELEAQNFDNDVAAVSNVSDSVNQNLDDVVKVGAALETLANLCDATNKAGLANAATVASHVFALEQLCESIGLANPVAALEAVADAEDVDFKEQTEAVGDKAKSGVKELGKRLLDGIHRIIAWVLTVIRNAMSQIHVLAIRARALNSRLSALDPSKTIDSKPFIISLRLVEGAGDVNEQFSEYGKLAYNTLFNFFNDKFKESMKSAVFHPVGGGGHLSKLNDVLKVANKEVFPVVGSSADVSAEIPDNIKDDQLTVGLTKPSIGGMRLYLAATIDSSDGENFYCSAGLVKGEVKLAEPDSIPVVDKQLAHDYLQLIYKWATDQSQLQKRFNDINNIKPVSDISHQDVVAYIKVLTALTSSIVPHLLRLNLKNSASFIAFVEKSLAVSGSSAPEK